jgi:tetratricopeptide (TPR) repeat protein
MFYMRRSTWVIPAILLLVAFSFSCSQKKEAKKHFDEAMRLKSTAISNAIEELQKAVKLDPKYAEAHFQLGVLYHHKKLFDETLKEYKIVQKLDPEFPKIHYAMGALFYTQGIFAWTKACQIDNSYLYKDDGTEIFYKEGTDPEEAIGKYKTLIGKDSSNALALYNLRGVLYDLAILEYQRALESNPYDTSAQYDLGLVYLERGKIDKAKEQLKLLENLSPGHALGLEQQMQMEEAQKKMLKGGK